MTDHCCHHQPQNRAQNAQYRRVLWIALAINAGMFLLEVAPASPPDRSHFKLTPSISWATQEITGSACLSWVWHFVIGRSPPWQRA